MKIKSRLQGLIESISNNSSPEAKQLYQIFIQETLNPTITLKDDWPSDCTTPSYCIGDIKVKHRKELQHVMPSVLLQALSSKHRSAMTFHKCFKDGVAIHEGTFIVTKDLSLQ